MSNVNNFMRSGGGIFSNKNLNFERHSFDKVPAYIVYSLCPLCINILTYIIIKKIAEVSFA